MKKSYIYTAILGTALMISGCDKYLEDYQDSPNDPTEVTAPLLLAATEVATFNSYTGQLARMSNIFTQHCAGTDFQFVDIAVYDIKEGDNINEWNSLYSEGMINAQTIINNYGDENPYYNGIAKILKAMQLGLATDMWGDIPNNEALLGLGADADRNVNPAYDSQEDVIADIQTMLDEAIADLAKGVTDNKVVPSFDDYVFGGDVASWTTTAYMLKARYYNRLSARDAAGSATSALAALTSAGTYIDCNAQFGGNGNENNQWYAFQQNRGGYIKMGEHFVNMLVIPTDTAMTDPRLSSFCALDDNNGYSGTPSSLFDQTTSNIGTYLASQAGSVPLISAVEAMFIEAEAKFRSGDAAGAATAHNDAVKASILQVTGAADAAFEAVYAAEDATSITLDKIMTQKYIAMFGQVEAYNDWRRTGIPALTPNPSAIISGIPLRLPTPRDERLYNSSATPVTNVLTPVWWDN
jgi:hypothetical protein